MIKKREDTEMVKSWNEDKLELVKIGPWPLEKCFGVASRIEIQRVRHWCKQTFIGKLYYMSL